MNTAAPWPAIAFLDALRPENGWTVDTALLASYSADIVSLVAALLALAGRDDEAGDGNPADLADAVEQLRGKVWFVVQEGRLATMRRRAAISVVLDQFVKSVRCDESRGSWHPKFSAVRFKTPQGNAWRIWIGSRNLTVASNLDFGLTLEGREGAGDGNAIGGIDQVVALLGEKAGLPDAKVRKLASECRKVRWIVPKGLVIREFRLLSPEEPGPALPRFADADEVVLISPFLDGSFVANAAGWAKATGSQLYLLSTQAELRKLAHQAGKPLAPFKDNLLVFDSPAREDTDPEPVKGDAFLGKEDQPRDEELVVHGLHAKLFAVRHGTKWQMWAGSANATTRAWGASNYELVSLLEGEKIIGHGLQALLGTSRTVTLESLFNASPALEDENEIAIEHARKQISAHFEGHLARNGDAFRLVSEVPLPSVPRDVRVQVGLMTGPLMDWSPDGDSAFLGRFDVAEQTGLVQWRLSAGEVECQWLHCLEVRPPLPRERDHAAIAARMTPSQFVAWVRSLLNGQSEAPSGLGSWRSFGTPASSESLTNITLEEVLATRSRRGSRIADLDARVTTYLKHVMSRCAGQPETLSQLKEFGDLWQLVRTELIRP